MFCEYYRISDDQESEMPPKKQSKTSKTTKKKAKKPSKTTKHVNKKGPKKLTDQQYAQMWVLREEGASLADIAREVGCHARTVSREFEKDPARHAGIVAVQSETRAALWKQIENGSLKTLQQTIKALDSAMFTPTGRISSKEIKPKTIEKLDFLRKMIGPLRMAADSATNKSQLLTGGPTQIMAGSIEGGGIGVDAQNMTDDEVIRLAIAHGLEDELPVALKEKVARMGMGKK